MIAGAAPRLVSRVEVAIKGVYRITDDATGAGDSAGRNGATGVSPVRRAGTPGSPLASACAADHSTMGLPGFILNGRGLLPWHFIPTRSSLEPRSFLAFPSMPTPHGCVERRERRRSSAWP